MIYYSVISKELFADHQSRVTYYFPAIGLYISENIYFKHTANI